MEEQLETSPLPQLENPAPESLPVNDTNAQERETSTRIVEPNSTSDPSGLWKYIQPRLAYTVDIPSTGFVSELLVLPKRRDVENNPHWQSRSGRFNEKTPRDVAAMVIQVTGDEAPEACTRCRDAKGPFQGCVVISTEAYPEAQSRYLSCANCLYRGTQTFCSLKEWVPSRPQPSFYTYYQTSGREMALNESHTAPPVDEDITMTGTPEAGVTATTELAGGELAVSDGISRKRQRLIAGGEDNERMQSPQSIAQNDAQSLVPARRPGRPAGSTTKVQSAGSSSLIAAGNVQENELLEMEEWEMAPGRLVDSSTTENPIPECKFLCYEVSFLTCSFLTFTFLKTQPSPSPRPISQRSKRYRCATMSPFAWKQYNPVAYFDLIPNRG